MPRQRPQQLLHEEFAGKGENNHVEAHEQDVALALSILRLQKQRVVVSAEVAGILLVRQKQERVDNAGVCRVQCVHHQYRSDKDERQEPGVSGDGAEQATQRRAFSSHFLRSAIGRRFAKLATRGHLRCCVAGCGFLTRRHEAVTLLLSEGGTVGGVFSSSVCLIDTRQHSGANL